MDLESRIKAQFPVLIVTLLSVLIGLDLSDLIGVIHARITLWPLDVGTLRSWGQTLAMGACCLAVWIIFAHMNISRLRIPMLADTLVVFLVPLMILFGNSLVGLRDCWPWLYFASAYLLLSFGAWQWQVRIALVDSELASFSRLTHPFGPLSVLYIGIPFYALAGWADRHGLLSPAEEALACLMAGPAALLTAWIFTREWRVAVDQAQTANLQRDGADVTRAAGIRGP